MLIALSSKEGSGEHAQIHRLARDVSVSILKVLDGLQSLKQSFINVSYHILVASLTLMATKPLELDWLQVYDMTP